MGRYCITVEVASSLDEKASLRSFVVIKDELCHRKTCPDMILRCRPNVTIKTIGALLSLQPMIPPGCSGGLLIEVFIVRNNDGDKCSVQTE